MTGGDGYGPAMVSVAFCSKKVSGALTRAGPVKTPPVLGKSRVAADN